MVEGLLIPESLKKILSPISRMSQIDPQMILIDPKGSEQ